MSAVPPITLVANPHFARLGGEAAVARLVDAFYAAMDAREDARAIRALHHADLAPTKAVLVTYLCEWLGGPKRYTAARGAPRLGRVHRPFGLTDAAADAWLACMRQALDETGVESGLGAELMASFTKVARHLVHHQPRHAHTSPSAGEPAAPLSPDLPTLEPTPHRSPP